MKPPRVTSEQARPFVLINMAMTADGKIATANRAIASFGSAHDHEHLLELRATADAVMSGARTVDSARINLGPGGRRFQKLRQQRGLAEFNLRIIVSGSGSINPSAEVFHHDFSPILILTTRRTSERQLTTLRQVASAVKICGRERINFPAALRWLRAEWGVNRIYAAIHQFGGTIRARNAGALRFRLANGGFATVKAVKMPARPFLGISPDDASDIVAVIERRLQGALNAP